MAAMTPPVELVFRRDEVIDEMARFVDVAFVVVPKFTVKRSMVLDAFTMIPVVVVGVSAPDTTFQSLKAVPM